MRTLKTLFDNNARWAGERKAVDPDFFRRLAGGQSPKYLWIGCSDARVPAEELVSLAPGELFVHRNVANLVLHTDVSSQSTVQFAVDCLQVEHIIVCGHYGCGGVKAAMENRELGLIDNWLRNIKDLCHVNREELAAIEDPEARLNRTCELNVLRQVDNVARTTIVQNAWKRGQQLSIHGWVYDMHDGLLHDLNTCVTGPDQLPPIYRLPDGEAEVDSLIR